MQQETVLLCLIAAVAAGINAVAGGGTLLTFPALVAVFVARGLDPDSAKVLANGTSTVGLFPATMAALWGYRSEFAATRHWLARLIPPSLIGGTTGALLVTQLPERSFASMVPWLILVAASLFTLQPLIAKRLGIGKAHEAPTAKTMLGIMLFQSIVGVYGGYFGAGIGILMLSALAMMGMSNIHAMNGLKSLLGGCINGSAVVIFIISGTVEWPLAISMAISGCIGSYAAARIARRLPTKLVRSFVIAVGFSLATYYFLRG